MERAIVHIDLDTFFVSCMRREDAALKGVPVIVGGGARGVVASCSYEARRFGVRSAMPMKMALRLCPEARVVRGDMELFSRRSQEVTAIIRERVPLMEKASIDEFYLDLSGMDRFFGCYQWSVEIAEAVTRETGLPISFALSTNKTVAKIGTGECKPLGRGHISLPEVQPFLNPLSIRKIPMLGSVTFQLLSRLGVRTIQNLAQMPPESLTQLIGKNGQVLWEKANGHDTKPVVPYSERKSISQEHTFADDTMNIEQLHCHITAMVEKLCFQLRQEKWLTSIITVKIRYANFDTETRQTRLAYTAADHTITRCALDLFDKVYTRRMRLRLVGVRFSGLVHGQHQMDLFEDTEERMNLYQTMDKLKIRFGAGALTKASGLGA